MRQRIIPIVVILLISLLGRPPVSEAATINVDESTCTLINAIIAANTNSPTGGCNGGTGGSDTIVLNADVNLTAAYGPSSSLSGNKAGLPDITSNITITAGTAPNDRISGNSSNFRIFNVVGGNLTLTGITVRNGSVSAAGGGIYVNGTSSLTLTNSTVTGNTVSGSANGFGGGIANFGTIASISNSTISNNSVQPVSNAADGYTARGGGIYNEGTITIIAGNSIISGNRADGGNGSGDNGGIGLGGGIYTASAINLNGVTLNANHVTGGDATLNAGEANGGGFYGGLSGTTTGLTVTNNTATGGNGSNPVGIAQGGGLWLNAVSTLSLSTISGNLAIGGESADAYGGGILITPLAGSPISLDQLLVENNTTTGGDGASFGGSGTGGGIAINFGPPVTISESTIRLNTASGGSGTSNGQGNGAGLFAGSAAGAVTIDSTTLNNNNATGGNGGGVFTSAAMTVVNSTISGNTASLGGGFYFTANTNDMSVQFTTILNNSASNNGEGIYLFGNKLVVEGSVIGSSGAEADCFGVDTIVNPDISSVKRLGDTSCDHVAPKNFQINVDISAGLQNNGGNTATHAIIGGHPNNNLINNVVSCGLATDQRGQPRDTVCDAGSYEIPTTPMVIASVQCVDPNLEVTITSGDGPFTIDASAGVNVPVTVGTGTHTVLGPEKWDNLSVQETEGDGEAINFGEFKCRPLETPSPLLPAHRSRTTNPSPNFVWAGITDAGNYRVFVFDDANPALRTVDIRENSGGPTNLTLNTPLPVGRLFWRVRGRVNRMWSRWSIRFTLFVDPPLVAIQGPDPGLDQAAPVPTPVPVVEEPPNSRGEAPAVMPPPPTQDPAPPIQPPNSR